MFTREIKELIEQENKRHYARIREIWNSVENAISDLQDEFKYHDCLIERLQADLSNALVKENEEVIKEICRVFDAHPVLSMKGCVFTDDCIKTNLGNATFDLLIAKGKLKFHHIFENKPYYTPTWR